MEFISQNWWILLFFAGYAFMMFRRGGCCGASSQRGQHDKNTESASVNNMHSGDKIELVLDPECGMYVNPDSAVKLQRDGKAFYFCSETCKKKFIQKHKSKVS